jgi:hypothetical protein
MSARTADKNSFRSAAALICRIPAASTTRNFFWLVCKNCNAPTEEAASFGLDGEMSQLSRVSATFRNRKSRKTLMRFEDRNSSG